jgi:hypothetical protein
LRDLRRFLTEQFGFGDFAFPSARRQEVARARDLNELEERLHEVPAESLAYHSERNHFSRWLRRETEFALAAKTQAAQSFRFRRSGALAARCDRSIAEYRSEQSQVLIGDFNASTFKSD